MSQINSFLDLQQQNPKEAAALMAVAAKAADKVESERPGLQGPAKRAAVETEVEQIINKLYHGVDQYVYDFPPLVDLAVDLITPYIGEAVDWAVGIFNHFGIFSKSTDGGENGDS